MPPFVRLPEPDRFPSSDRKSTRLNSSHLVISYAVFCLKKKTLSSHEGLKASRDNRWSYLGLVNEPCFEKATGPDPKRFGLWLDKRRVAPDCPAYTFENE